MQCIYTSIKNYCEKLYSLINQFPITLHQAIGTSTNNLTICTDIRLSGWIWPTRYLAGQPDIKILKSRISDIWLKPLSGTSLERIENDHTTLLVINSCKFLQGQLMSNICSSTSHLEICLTYQCSLPLLTTDLNFQHTLHDLQISCSYFSLTSYLICQQSLP